VCVCHSSFSLSSSVQGACLAWSHHVNQGVVQTSTPEVTLYETHTDSPSPTLPFTGFDVITTVSQSASVFLHLVFLKKKNFFFQVSLFLCLVREDPNRGFCRCVLLYVSERCSLPLCEGPLRVRWISFVKFQILFVINY
jgi:hypothetical protein